MVDGLLNNLLKNDLETHENIRKLATGQEIIAKMVLY